MRWVILLLLVLPASKINAQTPSSIPAPAVERVEFESAARPLGRLQERRMRERGEEPKPTPGDQLQGFLARPDGHGPFPAVLVLHGCGGLSPYVRETLPATLASWGYVALAVDSLTTRGVEHICVAQSRVDRVPDAYGGLYYLARLDFVNKGRVGILGIANGAMATLQLAEMRDFDSVVNTDKLTFKAGVAYYPHCGTSSGRTTFPLLIMVGRLDQWTPATRCEDLMRRRAADSSAMDLIIYPDAHHGFVVPDWGTIEYRLAYNEGAAQDSLRRAREFLEAHLGR